jgi:hypothetical protein
VSVCFAIVFGSMFEAIFSRFSYSMIETKLWLIHLPLCMSLQRLLCSLPALRRAAFALGARPTVDQFTAPLLRALLLARPLLRIELRVCAIVHAQLAADIGVLQRELMTATATSAASSVSASKTSMCSKATTRTTRDVQVMTTMTRAALRTLSGGVESAAAISPSLPNRPQHHAALPREPDEKESLHDDFHVQAVPAATARDRIVPPHASVHAVSLRLVNLHDCAEHGGFVGSSRGPFHQQQPQQPDARPPVPSGSDSHSSQQPISFRPTRHPLHRLLFAGAD